MYSLHRSESNTSISTAIWSQGSVYTFANMTGIYRPHTSSIRKFTVNRADCFELMYCQHHKRALQVWSRNLNSYTCLELVLDEMHRPCSQWIFWQTNRAYTAAATNELLPKPDDIFVNRRVYANSYVYASEDFRSINLYYNGMLSVE